jgi:hypothetical protein
MFVALAFLPSGKKCAIPLHRLSILCSDEDFQREMAVLKKSVLENDPCTALFFLE